MVAEIIYKSVSDVLQYCPGGKPSLLGTVVFIGNQVTPQQHVVVDGLKLGMNTDNTDIDYIQNVAMIRKVGCFINALPQ